MPDLVVAVLCGLGVAALAGSAALAVSARRVLELARRQLREHAAGPGPARARVGAGRIDVRGGDGAALPALTVRARAGGGTTPPGRPGARR